MQQKSSTTCITHDTCKISQLKNERLVLNNNIKVAIEELTSSKKMIEEQFGYFLNMDFSDLDNIVDLADFRLQEAVYLKENYITLSNRIRMKEKLLSDLDRIDSSNSLGEGFNKHFPSLNPTLLAAMGPLKGNPEIAKAAEDA